MSRIINVNNPVNKIIDGIKQATAPILKTMGAKGMYCSIERPGGGVSITKDGAIVASQVELHDQQENIGARLTVEATSKTAKEAGDGTTSTASILKSIVSKGKLYIDEGYSPINICNYLDEIEPILVDEIKKSSDRVDRDDIKTLKSIATISANGDDEIGGVVSDMVNKVGVYGEVSIARSANQKTYGKVVQGSKFNSGYGNYIEFVNNYRSRSIELENPLIVVTDHPFVYVKDIRNMLEYSIVNKRPLVVFGEAFEGEAFGTFVSNNTKAGSIALIKTPGHGVSRLNNMNDIVAVVGGNAFSSRGGDAVDSIMESDYGTCDRISVYEDRVVIFNEEKPDGLDDYTSVLKSNAEDAEDEIESQRIRERISRINGNVGVVYCGSRTDSEFDEKKDRLEDAILACKSAMEEGVMTGGGRAYYNLIKSVKQHEFSRIVVNALKSPILQICSNAGMSSSEVEGLIDGTNDNMGIDVSGVDYDLVDLKKKGIIDPAKVVRCAIQNGINVAKIALRTGSTIVFNRNSENG